MKDNDFKYKIELTKDEYEYLENTLKEFSSILSKMSDEELQKLTKDIELEKNLNFEKLIRGKTYKVNTYFNKDSEYTILQILLEILRK